MSVRRSGSIGTSPSSPTRSCLPSSPVSSARPAACSACSTAQLARHEHLVGAAYGIADVMTWPWINAAVGKLGLGLDAHPHLARWFEAVGRRPAVRRGLLVPLLPAMAHERAA